MHQYPQTSRKQLLGNCKTIFFHQGVTICNVLPDVGSGGISCLAAFTEVSHPAVVSKATHGDGVTALTTPRLLVHFVVFVERRARPAALLETTTEQKIKKPQRAEAEQLHLV